MATRTRSRAQLTLDDLFAYQEDGAQLDLAIEAGVETIGPSTINVPAVLTVAPRPTFGRCWCGRPIRREGQVECAEHDDPPPLRT